MHPFEDLVVTEGSVGIHWFGQSTLGLKDAQGTIVLVDPYYPRERPAERYVHARSCFVSRDYDPQEWAAGLQGVEPLIIPYNQSVCYSA